MRILNQIGRYPDELMYSWILRTAHMNGVPLRFFMEHTTNHEREWYPQHLLCRYDSFESLLPIFIGKNYDKSRYEALQDGLRMIKENSIFFAYAPVLTRYQQDELVQAMADPTFGTSNLLYKSRLFIHELKVCKECMQEDIDALYANVPYIARIIPLVYFHRAHQLAGVCTCHKHGVRLKKIPAAKGKEFGAFPKPFEMHWEELPASPKEIPEDSYAVFVKDLMDLHLGISIQDTFKAVEERLEDIEYDPKNIFAAEKWIAEQGKLKYTSDAFWNLLKRIYTKLAGSDRQNTADPALMLRILWILFGTAKDFAERIPEEIRNQEFLQIYSCDDCSKDYISTRHLEESGWGCPVCAKDMSDDERFREVFEGQSEGDYDLVTEYEALNADVFVKHHTCGTTYPVKAKAFIRQGSRCTCDQITPIEKIREEVADKGFTLTEYRNTGSPIKVKCSKCGSEIRVCHMYYFRHHDIQCPNCKN